MSNGTVVQRLGFDTVYSNKHTSKDTASALLPGCIPSIDPRCAMTRPAHLAYGSSTSGQPTHSLRTAVGPRRVLPSASVMSLKTTLDF